MVQPKEAQTKVFCADFRVIFEKQVSKDRKQWKTNVRNLIWVKKRKIHCLKKYMLALLEIFFLGATKRLLLLLLL